MQSHAFQAPPNILKEGEGGSLRMKREGEEEEVWWDCRQIDNSQIKSFTQKNLKFPYNNLKFKHIYCKYLHGE